MNACQVRTPSDNPPTPGIPGNPIPPTLTKVVLPTIIQTPTIPPTATQIPPTSTATEVPCLETSGKIQEAEFDSVILAEKIKTNIYLPPCYDPEMEEGYPFLVILHGQNGVQDQWIKLGLTNLADKWISSQKIHPFVIVMPFERLNLQNSNLSKFDSALVDDLLPQLMDQYNLRSAWEYRAIGGLSRGANWAVRIGFVYPQAFSKVGAHSFTTFTGDMARVQEWVQSVSAYRPALWFDIGENDQYRKFGEPFVLSLQQNQIPLEYHVNTGGHTNEYWMEHISEYLAWYTKDW